MSRVELYQEDLAEIHMEGYGFHWKRAAPSVLRFLEGHGIRRGMVLDLGCGGGEWLELLADAGYNVCGVDQSTSMIRAAKQRVPQGTFIQGSFVDVDLPTCDAVTSLGEPINYLDGGEAMQRVFRHVWEALQPGGIFVFDARERARSPVEPRTVTRLAEDWACISSVTEDHQAGTIVRDITTFLRVGDLYRRSHEIHRLKVYPKAEMLRWLRDLGFRVRTYLSYGDYCLADRQSVYVARKV